MSKLSDLLFSLVLAFILTSVTVFALEMTGNNGQFSWLETAAVFTSYSSAYLAAKESRHYAAIGFVSVIFLCLFFANNNLFASSVQNLILIPVMALNWYYWGKDNDSNVKVTSVFKTSTVDNLKLVAYMVSIYTISMIGYYQAFNYLDLPVTEVQWLDSFIFAGSIVAQILLTNKKIENWFVWIFVDIVAVFVYAKSGAYVVAAQFAWFTFNAMYGYIQWRKELTKEVVA